MVSKVIGLDFDNTLVSYDELFYNAALEQGLINRSMASDKILIRDYIRALDDGEILWQKLQAQVYGSRTAEAKLIEGVNEFLTACRTHNVPTHIVSHKTQFAAQDEDRVDLRKEAKKWMAQHNLDVDSVYFADTREEKVQQINNLGCTHFVDDLVEVFQMPDLNKNVEKILFTKIPSDEHDGKWFDNWNDIHDYIFS